MAKLELRLLTSRRIIPIGIDGYQIDNETKTDFIVVTGESNVTEIEMKFPEEIDGIIPSEGTIIIDLINARGQGLEEKPTLNENKCTITLDSRMTYRGYTKLYIQLKKDKKIVKWERFDIKIHSTSPDYSSEAQGQVNIETSGEGKKVLADDGLYHNVLDYLDDFAKKQVFMSIPNGSTANIIAEHNTDKTLITTPNSLNIIIPATVEHGYYAGVNFKTENGELTTTFTNESSYELKIINYGMLVSRYDAQDNKTVNMTLFCDGQAIYCYISEV